MSKPRSVDEMLPAATNFTVTQAERVRALDGLPAHLRRLGRIEQLLQRTRLLADKFQRGAASRDQVEATLDLVNVLIDNHNRYYPIEANLPIDRATGLPRDGDGPFVARSFLSLAELLRCV